MRGGTAADLLIDEVEVGELAHGGAGALLAGGGFLLLGQEVAPGEPRLLFPVLGAGALWGPSGFGSAAASARPRRGLQFPAQFYLFSRAMATWAGPLSWQNVFGASMTHYVINASKFTESYVR